MNNNVKKVFIVGSGSIGSALAMVIVNAYPQVHCLLSYRKTKPNIEHDRIELINFDPSMGESYPELIDKIKTEMLRIDWLINTCGLLHDADRELMPEKRLADFRVENFSLVVEANVLPTVLLAKNLARFLSKSENAIFASISARVGSISDNRLGGWYSYRASKACLNMMIKNIAVEWAYKLPNVCVLALHPGTTDSNLSKPFQKNVAEGKLFSPEQCAAYLLDVLNQREQADSGNFYDWAGKQVAW